MENGIYKDFYGDAYPAERMHGRHWRKNLSRPYREAVKFLPRTADLELRKVYYRPSLLTTFVSYPDGDVREAARIAMWLDEQGIETFFWEDTGRWLANLLGKSFTKT